MKVLYIGHYREGTGWAESAINHIKALVSVGIDVVCRPIKLNSYQPNLPIEVLNAENKSLNEVTHVIQHVLPHYITYDGRFKNIAIFEGETSSFGICGWNNNLELVDEVWLPNQDLLNVCQREVRTECKLVPHPSNVFKYNTVSKKLALENKFWFYVVGEFNRRKHISALFKAFHSEFERNDSVGLLLKVNKPGLSESELLEFCTQNSAECKRALRKYMNMDYYSKETFICNRLSNSDILALHNSCDCFVNTSFGESWSYPTFDAMAMGNLVISTKVGGPKDYLADSGLLVDGIYVPCFGSDPSFQDIHTANENWFEVDINDLRQKMREAYEMPKEEKERRAELGRTKALEYSYNKVGTRMKELLC